MDKKEKTVRLVDVSELEADLKKNSPKKMPRARVPISCSVKASKMNYQTSKTFPPSTRSLCGLWRTGKKFMAPV